MTLPRRRIPLSLALAGLALIAVLLVLPWVVHAQSEPTAPSNLTAQLVDGGALLTWNAPTEDADSVTGYEILRRRTDIHAPGDFQNLVGDTGSTATTYTDATANVAEKRYTYRVKALRGRVKSAQSNYASVDVPREDPTPTPTSTPTPTPTPTPTSTSTPAPDPEEATAGPLTGFTLLDASDQTELATLTDGAAVAVDDPAGGSYAIQANVEDGSIIGSMYLELTGAKSVSQTEGIAPYSLYGDGGESALSGGTLPVGSYDLQATAYSQGNRGGDELGTLAVSFTVTEAGATPTPDPESDPADLAPSNLVAEIVDGGVSLTWDAPAEDSSSVTGYQIDGVAEIPSDTIGQAFVALTGNTATTYTDTAAIQAGARYTYEVKALRDGEASEASNLTDVELPDGPADPAPSSLTFEMVDAGIVLTWTAPTADAETVTGYQILGRRADIGEKDLLVYVEDTESTDTSWMGRYLNEPGSIYVFRVKALRGEEKSLRSNKVTVERPEAVVETADRAPSNLAHAFLLRTDFTVAVALAWSAPAQDADTVTGYQVQRAVGSGEFATLADDTASAIAGYTDSTVTAGETYRYRVFALPGTAAEPAVPRARGRRPRAAGRWRQLGVRRHSRQCPDYAAATGVKQGVRHAVRRRKWLPHRPLVRRDHHVGS